MRGLYMERPAADGIPFAQLAGDILQKSRGFGKDETEISTVEQFCDDSEGEINRYNVYKIKICEAFYVLKVSDDEEIGIYEHFLNGKGLPVPLYMGSTEWQGKKWILIEYVEGIDLREFTMDMADACAESLAKIANLYWQENAAEFETKKQDDRFAEYWRCINIRAKCLRNEPLLREAYGRFLERQPCCPRTLSHGDFLQFNAIYKDGKVTMVDWAFGGIMPYSLDIARMIAHGMEDRETFPFYMTEEHKVRFVKRVYELLEHKPVYERYLEDIRLAVLNEYVEYIEYNLNEPAQERDGIFGYYYPHAVELAKEILRESHFPTYFPISDAIAE